MAANQEATRSWWDSARPRFDVFISEVVLEEAAGGNAEAAERRLAVLTGMSVLDVSEDAERLAQKLLTAAALPLKAKIDALHIAIATAHGIEYLLTWNCRHIANAIMRPRIEGVCRVEGYEPPVICTPLELMEE